MGVEAAAAPSGGNPPRRTELPNERVSAETPPRPGTDAPSLVDLLRMPLSEEGWEAFSGGSAIRRAGREGFARNVCVALGNWLAGEEEASSEAVAVLVEALSDSEPLVRGHAALALDRIGSSEANEANEAMEGEGNPFVGEELAAALAL